MKPLSVQDAGAKPYINILVIAWFAVTSLSARAAVVRSIPTMGSAEDVHSCQEKGDFGMIEKLVPIIVKALREISPWPWRYHESDFKHIDDESLAFLLRMESVDELELRFIASSPLWLAQMVVEVIEARKVYYDLHTPYRSGSICRRFPLPTSLGQALSDFSLTAEDWEWLKGKVGE